MENYTNEFGMTERTKEQAVTTLLKSVYVWMAAALMISGLTAAVVANNPTMIELFVNSGLIWGLFIAEFALVMALSAGINKLSFTTATLLFILYSVINGATLSCIFLVYTQESIFSTFAICAGTFAATAVYGSVTKRDLSSMGGILMMGLIGLIIATIVNIFVASSGLYWLITYAGVAIFVGLTAWDSQKIKATLEQADAESESAQKMALLGALELYLDFINLFLYLIRIFGKKR